MFVFKNQAALISVSSAQHASFILKERGIRFLTKKQYLKFLSIYKKEQLLKSSS